MKYLFILFTLICSLHAEGFHEERYSYAFDKTQKFQGDIQFSDYGVKIVYNDLNKSILYDDGDLKVYDGKKLLSLDEVQEQRMGVFLDILILVHADDTQFIKENFSISLEDGMEILTPKEEMKQYLKKIELKKADAKISFIKVYFKNDDTITINIDDDETN